MSIIEKIKQYFQKKWLRKVKDFKQYKVAYLFIAPAAIGMLLLHLSPILQGIYMAFLRLNQFTLDQYLAAPFVGFSNFYEVLFNPSSPIRLGIFSALRNTILYAVIVTFGTLAIAMIVALMLNRTFKGRALVRTLFLLPWIVPSFVVGILWGFMWQRETGIINIILYDVLHIYRYFHLVGINLASTKPFWLMGDPLTFLAIVIPTIWRGWPLSMLLLLAGLQNISKDYYEAAEIDGANGWQKFWHITFPMLKPVWAILILFGMIFNVYSFNIVYMMFGNGAGFPGDWGDLMMTNIFRNAFLRWDFGTGAAVSVLLMIMMFGAVLLWYRFYQKVEAEQ
jgi:multiple sugar transport system permease protein